MDKDRTYNFYYIWDLQIKFGWIQKCHNDTHRGG